MNRPKKDFIPTTLSDLNIDAISIGSNGDRHNNNSNGARLNNFDRFKATSSSNLSYKHSNINSNNNNVARNNSNSNSFANRSSKLYSSQSNLSTTSSTGSRYQAVVHSNNYNISSTSKSTASGDMDKWLQAWEDTNNNFRAPSYHSNAHHHQQQQQQHSKVLKNHNDHNNNYNRSNSNSFKQSAVAAADPFDPFDDPWSGTSIFLFSSLNLFLFAFLLYFLHTFSHGMHTSKCCHNLLAFHASHFILPFHSIFLYCNSDMMGNFIDFFSYIVMLSDVNNKRQW